MFRCCPPSYSSSARVALAGHQRGRRARANLHLPKATKLFWEKRLASAYGTSGGMECESTEPEFLCWMIHPFRCADSWAAICCAGRGVATRTGIRELRGGEARLLWQSPRKVIPIRPDLGYLVAWIQIHR